MSQSPLEEAQVDPDYFGGWSAVAGLIRRGRSWSGGESNRAFLGLGDGRFADVSAPAGLDQVHDGRSVARVDWDQDGDLDLIVTGRDRRRLRYLRNDARSLGSGEEPVSVRLVGKAPGTNALGARIVWWPAGKEAPRGLVVQRAGEGYLSQSSSWHVLGGQPGVGIEVEVHWPRGEVESFGTLERGTRAILVEGSGRARKAFRLSDDARGPGSGSAPADPGREGPPAGSAMILALPVPLPTMAMVTADGREAELFGLGPRGSRGTGRPLVVHLWASWCTPCVKELRDLGSVRDVLRTSGVDSLALSLDEIDDHDSALATLQALEWGGSRGFAAGQTAEVLDAVVATVKDSTERLALPTTLLVSPSGRLVALYTGPVEGERLVADLELLGLTDRERQRRALPFDGLWLDPPAQVSLALYEGKLRRRGLEEAAAEYALAQVEIQSVGEARAAYEFGVARARQGRNAEALVLFRKAVAADGTDPRAWSALGWAADVGGEKAEALNAYRRAIELEPGDAKARFNLGRLLLAEGQVDEAREQAQALRRWDAELAVRLLAEVDSDG